MRIDDVFEIDNKTVVAVHGDELRAGMIITKISTPFGIFDVTGDSVREACFCPGHLYGLLALKESAVVERCEAEILEYTYEKEDRGNEEDSNR